MASSKSAAIINALPPAATSAADRMLAFFPTLDKRIAHVRQLSRNGVLFQPVGAVTALSMFCSNFVMSAVIFAVKLICVTFYRCPDPCASPCKPSSPSLYSSIRLYNSRISSDTLLFFGLLPIRMNSSIVFGNFFGSSVAQQPNNMLSSSCASTSPLASSYKRMP